MPTRNYTHPLLLLLALFPSFVALPACDNKPQQSEVVQPLTDEQVRRWVEKIRSNVDEDLQEMTQSIATGSEIAEFLNKEAERPFRDRVRDGVKYADLFQTYYRDDNFRLHFVTPEGLSPRAKAIVDVVKRAPDHALSTKLYGLDKIDILTKKLAKQNANLKPWNHVVLTPSQVEKMIPWIMERQLDLSTQKSRNQVLAAMVGYELPDDSGRYRKLDTPPLPELASQVDDYLEAVKKQAVTLSRLELRTADAALRYARDMKHFNLRNYSWKEKQAAGGAVVIIYGRLRKTLEELVAAKTPEEASTIMRDLEPKHEQYQKLVKVLARYREIKKNGGWPQVARFPFSLYSRAPVIATLRKRLEIEGFLGPTPAQLEGEAEAAAEINASPADETRFKTRDRDLMDKELLDAVRNYQRTHQFTPRGYGSRALWNSINVPVERRIKQIKLALDRVRDFAYRGEKDYVYVNIPDFHGEVWFDKKRVDRFEVVVGNNRRKCDPKKEEWTMPNATPIQYANLEYIIVNPYWNVPRRIVEDEILPHMEADETYLDRKGYELLDDRPGKEQVRQKPGPTNALGKIKFIFPNRFNTYMHDTPSKEFFDYPVRAFSHGCVRVQNPLDFAEVLLTHLTDKTREWLDETVKSERTVTVKINKEVPVFFEYSTVRVDDDGRANFLADIYKYDQEEFRPTPASAKRCVIEKPDEKKSKEGAEAPADTGASDASDASDGGDGGDSAAPAVDDIGP